ncbi:uncharacterized protein LOC143174346 [Nomia melanderi]|uniref:uncharacterized protein LOC143174346 n=1 Tax=Nomia melanderi TaxID=2448451 RepID=UPI003FCEB97E
MCLYVTKYDDDQGALNYCDFRQVDKEIENIKLNIQESRDEYMSVETEICEVNQLKDKGLFILKDTERKYKELQEEMKQIHCEYIECVKRVNSYDKVVHNKIESLTLQRDNLKKELEELQERTEDNSKKLEEIKKAIVIQEKKNMALLRKLKKMASRKKLSPDMREQINAVFSDSRITKTNVPNQTII